MKKLFVLLHLYFLSYSFIYGQYDKDFKMSMINDANTERIVIDKTVYKNTTFNPFTNYREIGGLSIDADISTESEDYLVRILLKDKEGKEYLIMEAYQEIFEEKIFSINDYSEETIYLKNIKPDSIKVCLRNAHIHLKSLTLAQPNLHDKKDLSVKVGKIKERQSRIIADKINRYNQEKNKLWVAGVTPLSMKEFEDKKRILNMSDDGNTNGLEYYIGGIFEVGNVMPTRTLTSHSQYVSNFDWRDQHGRTGNYWLTPVKDQGDSGFCVFFSIIGCTEALANLYYNTNLNLDLSEMELGWCCGIYDPYYGVAHSENNYPFDYMTNHGVCSESSYPFVDTSNDSCRSEEINENELVKTSGYYYVNAIENDIKDSLINRGPLVAGIEANNIWHAMVLVGYGTIKEGDVINQLVNNNSIPLPTIQPGDPRIGKTYWIFKDSYLHNYDAVSHNPTDGYAYVMFEDCSQMGDINTIKTPIIISSRNINDVICEDADGDGYYNWGIGPKPSNCPYWVPDIPDGDDSNTNYGMRDSYGHLEVLTPGITINTPVTYSSSQTTDYRIGIVNGGKLTITDTTTLYGNGKIRVCEGGVLEIDGGTLENADIELIPGAQVILRNNGIINMANGKNFVVPLGVVVNIDEGIIN